MGEERVIDKLRKGEKILCPICKKHYYDISHRSETANYFHCEDPDCKGYVHEQKQIDVD